MGRVCKGLLVILRLRRPLILVYPVLLLIDLVSGLSLLIPRLEFILNLILSSDLPALIFIRLPVRTGIQLALKSESLRPRLQHYTIGSLYFFVELIDLLENLTVVENLGVLMPLQTLSLFKKLLEVPGNLVVGFFQDALVVHQHLLVFVNQVFLRKQSLQYLELLDVFLLLFLDFVEVLHQFARVDV